LKIDDRCLGSHMAQNLPVASHLHQLAIPNGHSLGDRELVVDRENFPIVKNVVGVVDDSLAVQCPPSGNTRTEK